MLCFVTEEVSAFVSGVIVDIELVDGLVLSVLWLSAGMALDKLKMNNFPSLNGKIEIYHSQCNLRYKAINIYINILQN